jgi:SpoVK/Ycf46/Vps4 family AAA+-type ATPase
LLRTPLAGVARPELRQEVPASNDAEQLQCWRQALGAEAEECSELLGELASQFRLTPRAVSTVCRSAKSREALWDGARKAARGALDELAQRLTSAPRWDDLVLPEGQREILTQIAAQVRQRTTVYGEWGFHAAGARGLGLAILFAGPPGTGKTLAAEVLATELKLDLYRIDLSSVVSKYIGDTERNLRRVFDAAESCGAILLFDEADALFGPRSEVKDSHDRYANIEVSYLLQRMESYRGLAVLTTNRRRSLDEAFQRRLRFAIEFPLPDFAHREAIWRRVFPVGVPLGELIFDRLASLDIAGGNIRNIALNAAFLAASAGTPVAMRHLAAAARAEYAKMERSLTQSEIEGWE